MLDLKNELSWNKAIEYFGNIVSDDDRRQIDEVSFVDDAFIFIVADC